MKIKYIDALAGAGKTHALLEIVHFLSFLNEIVLVVQPTRELIDRSVSDYRRRFKTTRVKTIYSDGQNCSVVDQIMGYLKNPEPGIPLFITQIAFLRIPFLE